MRPGILLFGSGCRSDIACVSKRLSIVSSKCCWIDIGLLLDRHRSAPDLAVLAPVRMPQYGSGAYPVEIVVWTTPDAKGQLCGPAEPRDRFGDIDGRQHWRARPPGAP